MLNNFFWKTFIKAASVVATLVVVLVLFWFTALSLTGCGTDVIQNEPGNVLNHTHEWGNWTTKTPATCTEAEVQERVCSLDPLHKETQNVGIPLGHSVPGSVQPTCATPGNTGTGACARCSETVIGTVIPIDPNAHDWNDYKQTTPPTCTIAGIKTRDCKHNSDHIDTVTQIGEPALGHEGVGAIQPTCTTL